MSRIHIRERRDRDLTILDLARGFAVGFRKIAFGLVLEQLIDKGQNQIILNFSNVHTVDAEWLGELVSARQRVLESTGQLKMCELNDRILELMALSKLLPVFEIFKNETLATASFKIRRNKRAAIVPERIVERYGRDRLKIF